MPNTFLGEKKMTDDDETILHDRPHKDPGRARAAKVGVRGYYKLRSLYEGVLSRINTLEDDTRAAIEFADLAEDDKGTEMILEFCEDITKLVGE